MVTSFEAATPTRVLAQRIDADGRSIIAQPS
jgi:hypothetical protein